MVSFIPMVVTSSGCTQIENWRNPEVAACEAYTIETLKSPSTYKRASFVVVDQPVSKEMLAKAMGASDMAKGIAERAEYPGIRGIALDYEAENSFGATIKTGTGCEFPMSDLESGEPAQDLNSLVRFSLQDRQITEIADATGSGRDDSGVCCLARDFDSREIPIPPAVEDTLAAASAVAGDTK